MSSSTPLRLAALRELADQHYDISVLTLIQRGVVVAAIEEMQLNGIENPQAEAIRARAAQMLPEGYALTQMYFRRFAEMSSTPIEVLESTSSCLTFCAKHLEGIAARNLAQDQALPDFANAMQSIGHRYAQLIQAARTLEDNGVISVSHTQRLAKLVDRPEGPLEPFYDKALALLDHHQAPRDRMAA